MNARLPLEQTTLSLHLATLNHLLGDSDITEIVINEPYIVHTENQRGGWQQHDIAAITTEWCLAAAWLLQNSSSQHIHEESPHLDAKLPDGQRVHIVIPPAVASGKISITIRRPSTNVLTLENIIDGGAFDATCCEQSLLLFGDERARLEAALSERDKLLLRLFRQKDWLAFWRLAVSRRKNIVSSGKTGSGKTTLSNALGLLIPEKERLITLEDVAETQLPHANQVNQFYSKDGKGVSKLTPKNLLEGTLRMRPDRVLIPELRSDEIFFFIQNVLNSGHPGTITTIHATRAKLVFRRMSLMIQGSPEGAGLSEATINETLYSLIDVVAQMDRQEDGKRSVTEVYFDPAFALKQMG